MSAQTTAKITLKDIAQRVGVSPTAVSHVLNDRLGRVRVSKPKRQEIRQIARDLGYVPQLSAKSMVTQKSYTIGALCSFGEAISDLGTTAYFASALRGVEEVCRSVNYHCIFASCELYDPERFVRPRVMRDGSTDGVILIGYTSDEVAGRLADMGLPCVQVGSNVSPSTGIPYVEPDLDEAFAVMAGRLHAQGHRHVELFLPAGPGPEKLADNFRRVGAQYDGLQTTAVLAPHVWTHPDQGYAYARDCVGRADRPTALLCNSLHARGLVRGMSEAGLTFPRDYSLILFSSVDESHLTFGPEHQPIAQITLPVREVARQAAARLFGLLNIEGDLPHWQEKITCGFIDQPSWGAMRPATLSKSVTRSISD